MAEIFDPEYWRERLSSAGRSTHHAIFMCSIDVWRRIEEKHRQILADKIQPDDSILDVGCAWGRLLTLLPETWHGYYLGMDISPDFIEMAYQQHPNRDFVVRDITKLPEEFNSSPYDWAVISSVRPMIIRHLGGVVWDPIEKNLRKICKRLLYLEYDENDNGSVE